MLRRTGSILLLVLLTLFLLLVSVFLGKLGPAAVQPVLAQGGGTAAALGETCTDVQLVVSVDTHMRSGNTRGSYNYGGAPTIELRTYYSGGTNDGQLGGALLKWDVTSIPTTATISSASVTFYVTDTSVYSYSLYNMARTWTEGSNNGATGSGASWNYYDAGTNKWAISGAQGTATVTDTDRYTTNLWDATPSTFGTSGFITIPLNAAGVQVLQGWVAGSVSNYGLTMQNYAGTTVDVWGCASSEATTAANWPRINLTYCVATPGPAILVTSTMTAFSSQPGVPSAAQSYTVSGNMLSADIVITAPTDFEISTNGTNYYSSRTLTQSGGTVSPTTIWVRLNRATEGTPSGNITHTSTDATTKNVTVSGTVVYVYTLTVGNDGHGTVTLNPSGGSYNNGTTVTLTPVPSSGYLFDTWSGTDAGDVVYSGGVYTIVMNEDKSVTANFAPGSCSVYVAEAAEDTYVSASDVQYNNGGNTSLHVDATTGTSRRAALMKWDLSTIPTTATVSAATLSVYVSDASTLVFNLYNMRRSWVEGTVTQTNSTTSANWNTYDGVNSWGTVGIANISSDRYDTNLWGATASSFSATGSRTVALNTDGVAAVQGWITTPANNYGLTMQNYYAATANAVFFASSEHPSNAGPTLTITYCHQAAPTITTVGTLSAFSTEPGTPSAYQTYTVSGVNLTAGILVTAPTGFEIATASGGPYNSSLTLSQSGGTVGSTTIYVRLTGAAEGSFSGNITHTSSGATEKDVAASGTVTGVNEAPELPVLVSPADDATGVIVPATLTVTVTDPDEDDLCVTFWGREVGTGGEDFRLFVIPDAQNMATSYPAAYNSMTQYISDTKTTLNVAFATCVGDIVNTSSSATEYGRADAAYGILDTANVPYSVGPGNHDVGGLYETYFGVSRFSGKSWYGGHYGSDNYNSYSLFSASGMDFILINLQYNAGSAVLDWADARLKEYSTRRAIVEQHDMLNVDNNWTNQTTYNALRDNENLFLMLCGHMHASGDGAAYLAGTTTLGKTIHVVHADYQDFPSGGNGYLRILRFMPSTDVISMTTYSPYTGGSITTDPDQKNMAYDMAGAAAFANLGTVCSIASGGHASLLWPGLASNSEYEWYTVISDGISTTLGSTWSFTTGAATGSLGDVNGDGKANSTDALIILSADVGMSTASYCPMNCGDVNNDGLVNSTDALIILSYDVGMSVPYPIMAAACPSTVTQPPGCSP